MQEWKHGAYHADVRRYDHDSLCQGVIGHKLCTGCSRFFPGPLTPSHFLKPPARDAAHCSTYRPKVEA